jgi:SRSO17 transposase
VGRLSGPRLARAEPRRRAAGSLRGLPGDAGRTNGRQLAEYAGDHRPCGAPRPLGRAGWDADAARDGLTRSVAGHPGGPGPVLAVDETGFLKRGDRSVGVQRRHSGTAGRVANCQVGVFLALAGRRGHAPLDRAPSLPRGWADDPPRRRAAGVPEGVAFATEPEPGRRVPQRAFAAGARAARVTADAVYGNDGKFRRPPEEPDQPYVLAVQAGQRVWVGPRQARADGPAAGRPAGAWRRASAGGGAQGPRPCDWAVAPPGLGRGGPGQLRLPVRRHREGHDERAYYPCRPPAGTPWRQLARVAGVRRSVEGCCEPAKGGCGLADNEVRSGAGWHRHVTPAVFALAVAAAGRARASRPAPRPGGAGA